MRICMVALAIVSAIPAFAAVPQEEREALVALFESTGGSEWSEADGWLGDPGSECDWFGVTCDEAGAHVVEIYLESNNLTGALPAEIGSLSRLESLTLARGEVGGAIPPSLGSLSSLRVLDLYLNRLEGEIPSELGNLGSLEHLNLFANDLSGSIPPALGGLSSLKVLDLSENRLDGQIPALSGLFSLEELRLSENDLSGEVPDTIGALTALRIVNASGNNLSGSIPESIGSLVVLEELDLSQNELSGAIPPSLGELASLRSLDLYANELEGPIPAGLGGLSNLEWLVLSDNDLGGAIPSSLGNLPNLRFLDLSGARLTGSIPSELASLPLIEELILGQSYDFGPRTNRLTGGIPPDLGSLTTLRNLSLGFNDLGGSIPSSLGDLDNLEILDLSANELTGTIPTALGHLSRLRSLTLAFNNLSGGIPVELAQITGLRELDLEVNDLSGPIPAALGSLRDLTALLLNENQLTGPIPQELGGLTNLETLYLNDNQLTGPIPSSFANLSRLRTLILFGNELEGPIPSWLGTLTELTDLLIDGNRLTGPIPPQLTNLTNLTSLGLGSNFLTGTVPTDIGALKEMEYLSLDSAGLSGALPSSIWDMTRLIDARLEDNDFTGTIPPAVGQMSSLSLLLLSGNQMSGTLPVELGDLPSIAILGLDGNRFTGQIPAAIGNATSLEFLGLEKNALRGEIPATLPSLGNLQQMRLGFNALTTSDPDVRQFVDERNDGGPFGATQTVPPDGVAVSEITDRSAVVSWTPIAYTENDGGYEVRAIPTGGGSAVVSTTGSKRVGSHILRGLLPETTYEMTVRTTTHPFGDQQNFIRSDSTTPVSFTTTERQTVPAVIDLVSGPTGLIQIGGVPQNEDNYVLGNFGDLPATIVLERAGDHFEQEPESFVLQPGATQTVTLRSIPDQPADSYWGLSVVTGDGVPEGLDIPVILLSAPPPVGSAIGEALASRVDVFGGEGTNGVGTVRFRNRGTATLQGVLVSDSSWIRTSPEPITIPPGEVRAVSFDVVRARRPLLRGAVTGSVRLVYVASSAGKRGPGYTDESTAVSTTLVKVVDTVVPETRTGVVPDLDSGEIRRLIPGASRSVRSSGTFVSDLSVANAFGSRNIDDLAIIFDRAGSDETSIADVGTVPPSTSLVLANVVQSVYGDQERSGTIHIRTSEQERLQVEANISNVTGPLGEMRGSIPVFRTDRAVEAGESSYLMDLRISPRVETILMLQEAAGGSAGVDLEYRRATGEVLSAEHVDLGRFELRELADTAPSGTELVRLRCTEESDGAFVAYALVIDRETGSVSTLVDWTMVLGYPAGATVRVPIVLSGESHAVGAPAVIMNGGSRRRPVSRPETVAEPDLRTSLTVMNPGTEASVVEVSYFESTGSVYRQRETVPPGGMTTISDVATEIRGRAGSSTGYAVVEMIRGSSVVTAAVVRRNGDVELTSTVPVIVDTSGLRLGQSIAFAGLEDSTSVTVLEARSGSVRTGFGLTEISGSPVTVRADVAFAGKSPFVSSTISKTFALAARETIYEKDLLAAILGPQRDTVLGDVKNVQLTISVVGGEGAVTPFVAETENSSGDTRFIF